MKAKRLASSTGEETYALIFDPGDEVISTLTDFAQVHKLFASHFTAIGAFQQATLAYFDPKIHDYLKIPIDEQVEVLALVGDISEDDGKPKVHAHVVVGKRDGSAHGGHLLEARVYPTLEVMLEQTPKHLRRRYDPKTGLDLIDLNPREVKSTEYERIETSRSCGHHRGIGGRWAGDCPRIRQARRAHRLDRAQPRAARNRQAGSRGIGR